MRSPLFIPILGLAIAACSQQPLPPESPISPPAPAQKPAQVVDVDLTANSPAPPKAQAATDGEADAGADAATEATADPDETENAGVVGLLATDSTLGGLTGGSADAAFGAGGLGISGTGPGGGGTGVGLGGIGTGPGRGGARFAKWPRPATALGAPQAQGKLPPDVIRRVVRSHMGRIRYCYERRLLQNPKLEGKFVVQFVIGKDGSVVNAQTKSATMPDPQVIACVVSAFRDMAFQAPDGGGVVVVSYPIMFNPGAPPPPPAPAPSATKPPAPPTKP